jgi:hypothetical protein
MNAIQSGNSDRSCNDRCGRLQAIPPIICAPRPFPAPTSAFTNHFFAGYLFGPPSADTLPRSPEHGRLVIRRR